MRPLNMRCASTWPRCISSAAARSVKFPFPSRLNLIHSIMSLAVLHSDIAGAMASVPLKIRSLLLFASVRKSHCFLSSQSPKGGSKSGGAVKLSTVSLTYGNVGLIMTWE